MLIALVFVVAVVYVLLEFNRRLRALEATVDRLAGAQGSVSERPQEPSAEVKVLAASGHKIEAIRLYRQQSGAELRQALQVVEALEEAGPGAT